MKVVFFGIYLYWFVFDIEIGNLRVGLQYFPVPPYQPASEDNEEDEEDEHTDEDHDSVTNKNSVWPNNSFIWLYSRHSFKSYIYINGNSIFMLKKPWINSKRLNYGKLVFSAYISTLPVVCAVLPMLSYYNHVSLLTTAWTHQTKRCVHICSPPSSSPPRRFFQILVFCRVMTNWIWYSCFTTFSVLINLRVFSTNLHQRKVCNMTSSHEQTMWYMIAFS